MKTGALLDKRSKQQKRKDWGTEELLATAQTPEWKEKKEWRTFTARNQKNTNSCVAQATAKALEVNEWLENEKLTPMSATKAYADRTNNGAGSFLWEMLDYAVKNKYTTEDRLQSQYLMSDKEMDRLAKEWDRYDTAIAKKYAGKSYHFVNYKNPEEVALCIQQGYGVVALFWFTSKEWGRKFPQIKNKSLTAQKGLRHAVTLVDFGLKNGKKYFKVEDSAWFGGKNERWITEDWLRRRCFGAGIIHDKRNKPVKTQKWAFKRILWKGMRNKEVVMLQDRLKLDDVFPKSIPSTGYYGSITAQAVRKFQLKHQIASTALINWINGRWVGIKTRRYLNK